MTKKKKQPAGRVDNSVCRVCKQTITVMCFKGTGVCCENHRKVRDGEA